jgi:hypothetical protein
LTSVTIGNSVTNIGSDAFYDCSSLVSVTIPDNVTSIGDSAFSFCAKMSNVTIGSSVVSIGNSAFKYCTNLSNVTIPDSVTSVEDYAFEYCTHLTNVTIGNSVASIGNYTFVSCTNLASLTIPSSVINIGDYAISDCTSLRGVYFQGNTPNIGASVFSGNTNTTVYYLPGTTGWNPEVQRSGASFGVRTNCFGFNITGSNHLSIVVLASTNLAQGAWSPVSTNTIAGGLSYFSDPQWTNYPSRFYRLWGLMFAGLPAVLWNPQVQTGGDSFGVRTNRFGFNITGTANIPIVVIACTNLAGPVWVPLQSCTLTNGSVYFSDPQWTNYPGRFYRIRSP